MRRITIKLLLLCLSSGFSVASWGQYEHPDTWWLCPIDRSLPLRPDYSQPVEAGSTEIRADASRLVENGITQFSGNVEFVRGSRAASGDVISYEDARSLVSVEGNATIWDASVVWQGESASFNLDSDLGTLNDGNYWLSNGRGRGRASVIESDRAENISILRNVDYTTCPTDKPSWLFSSKRLRLDHDVGRGSATHALLKVKRVPVFYLPYISFPLDDRRKSGFLLPTVGTSNQSGFDIRVPYYLNLAPNYDATLTPRLLDSRGLMLAGEFRYKQPEYNGQVEFEYLPSDKLRNNSARSLASFWHNQRFDHKRGQIRVRMQNVSDAQYFEDFGRSLSVTSQRFLDRRVDLWYRRPRQYQVTGIVQSYQQVDDSPSAFRGPYRRLPQLNFSTLIPQRHLQLSPRIQAQSTYFYRPGSVSGGRFNVVPSIAYPFLRPYARITPRFSIDHTEYVLNGEQSFDKRETRTVPIASLDAQFAIERRLSIFGIPIVQTLEPRANYLYIPKVNQDDIPTFDSGQFDIQFRNLFRENRFSGRDRINDANRVALAATTRFIDLDSGRELLRASIGQRFFFEDREITLPGRSKETQGVSEFIAEVAANVGNGWSARTTVQYDPTDGRMEKAAYNVRYRPSGSNLVVNAGYRRRRAITDVEQTDLSFRIPLTSSLGMLGRWNYSLQNNRNLELVGGLEYESCCWGARLVGRRFLRNTEGAYDTAIFMQFEFKGFVGYGRGTSSFLRKSIPGYDAGF